MSEIKRHEVGARMSQMVVHGDTIYTAGQVAQGAPGGSVAEQTQDILGQIDTLLAAAGSDKTRILSATIYLTDMAGFAEMNAVWDAWVPEGHTPCRACVEARLASPDFAVEIQVIAAR
ncbi:RidA family protein [Antarcticimicrobium sediminis]|uniref:RidA family protein n=1 Tax=Antarcticimicrobium sediminis TaxID=2546227 RepID=A0A4R5ELH1_9RHOB|nr:RidA family protein [Antarcticimicrobium sediminis]TDE35408.1 RidA family protein [Antarcticimicrobium sediminis]